MTIFSAGTFVVWGGIAYRSGMAAVSILVCLGISSILVGVFFAGKWRKSGVTTPAEFVKLRFGNSALQFLTWFNAVMSALAMSVGLYALSVIVAALINLPPNHLLADPATGKLSITSATLICGAIVVIYTAAGGLWAVLMTDVVQCIVLSLTVVIVVPLCLIKIGGIHNFISNAPAKFFHPANSEFTYKFFICWIAVNTFRLGGLWSLVQRYICVPTPNDAKKVAVFTGLLFIICPFLWMFPAMSYRLMNPDANPEQAYILACQTVLPAGMLGMVLATMFSATASMISGELNVYAGVFTRDIYRVFIRPDASEKHLVFVGRTSTII
jgi:SSS family solute:Na+ symporter